MVSQAWTWCMSGSRGAHAARLPSEKTVPYFGAIDGTHVEARLPPEKAVPYFGRKGCYTQNIIAAYDFDVFYICFYWMGR